MRYLLAFLLSLPVLGQLMMPHRVGSLERRAAWYDTNWSSRTMLQVSSPNTVTNYAVKLTLSAANFDFSKSNGDGSDLRVTDNTGTNLVNYYVRSFDTNAQTGEIWVKPVLINSWAPTTLYLYYGNASPSAFTLPPTGLYTRPNAASFPGIASGIVYDSDTSAYYTLINSNGNNYLTDYSATTLSGPWTVGGIILSNSVAGWDAGLIHTFCLFKDSTNWYLYYSASPSGATLDGCQVGYATATNISGPYTKYGSNPVVLLGATNTWDSYRLYVNEVVQIGSTWYLLYSGIGGAGATLQHCGYATATSPGGPWTKYAGNPFLRTGGALMPDYGLVTSPSYCGRLHGWDYICYSGMVSYLLPGSLLMAQTRDWVNFYKVDDFYTQGCGTEWDSTDGHHGHISMWTNVYYMTYNGKATAPYSSGIATMSTTSTANGFDPNQVFDYYDDFTGVAVDANRWGVSSANGSDTVSGGIITINSGTSTTRMLTNRRFYGVGKMLEGLCRHVSYPGVSQNYSGQLTLMNTGATRYFRLFDLNSTNWMRDAFSVTPASMAQAASTNWVTHQIYIQTPALTLYRNDLTNAWESVTTPVAMTNALPVGLRSFTKAASGVQNDFAVDYVIVREYRTNEPTVTVIGAQ